MQFYSTSDRTIRVSLSDAVMRGLAPDGGLYMPEIIPELPQSFFRDIPEKSFAEIALAVANPILGKDLPTEVVRQITGRAIQFDAPLVGLEDNFFSLELFHGPTLAFKDFGARFLSGVLGHFASRLGREITILVATSGDTGSAVANGFLKVPGTRIIILYPSGKISEIQEKQFTTLGANVTALEIDGTFDDCQALVKRAFSDDELNRKISLTSANSINIGRLIPQMFYYFYAFAQLKDRNKPIVFSVPSGNLGNLTAGLISKRMGLPVYQFIAATNANKVVPDYLQSAVFTLRDSVQTVSNAMDVGNPSNFSRVLDLYDYDFGKLSKDITGLHFSDAETRSVMAQVFEEKSYVLDPHTAIAYLGLKRYVTDHPGVTGIFLATAHPGKFQSIVEETLRQSLPLPERLAGFLKKEKKSIRVTNRFEDVKAFLLA